MASTELAGKRSSVDAILDVYRKDVDRTLLRENLRLTPDQRVRKMIAALEFIEALRAAPKNTPGMTAFGKLLERFQSARIESIVVGGMAAAALGAARVTYDLDLVYRRTSENIARLVASLAGLEVYLRGAPPGLPFRFDAETVQRGLNFTLTTSLGDLDLMGEIAGGGGYEQLRPFCYEADLLGVRCLCLGLEKLIEVKRAAGRPKDFEAIAELEALREEG